MSLNPIVALNRVIDEYRDYLLTEFRANDPALRAALERELDRPLFLAQEPFYQAHRPFRSGKRWRDLPLDPKLSEVMGSRARVSNAYLHQSLAPNSNPILPTTLKEGGPYRSLAGSFLVSS